MMGVKRSAKERPRNRRTVPFVCRGVSLESPFVRARTNDGGREGVPRSAYGAHMANRVIRHEIRKMRAIMASQLSRVRVSLFIEYRVCLFLRRACVPR